MELEIRQDERGVLRAVVSWFRLKDSDFQYLVHVHARWDVQFSMVQWNVFVVEIQKPRIFTNFSEQRSMVHKWNYGQSTGAMVTEGQFFSELF